MSAPQKDFRVLHPAIALPRGKPAAERTLSVAEVFNSRQGEGKLTGVASHFIRLSGCNLRCWFCDTPYASWQPTGQPVAISDLISGARGSGLQHVVLTGGEPLLFSGVETLVAGLRAAGLHVTIETAGTIASRVGADLMSISPKLSRSGPRWEKIRSQPHLQEISAEDARRWHRLHQRRRWAPQAIGSLIQAAIDYQVKFVVDGAADAEEVLAMVRQLSLPKQHVWIMPQGITAKQLDHQRQWLQPWSDQQGFQYCDRLQIHWYGNRPGT